MVEAWNEVHGSGKQKTSGTGNMDELFRRLDNKGMLGE